MKIFIIPLISLLLWGCGEPNSPEPDANTSVEISPDQVKTTIQGDEKKMAITSDVPESDLQLTSTAFEDESVFPAQYTCDGENIIPPLTIQNIPQGTQSLIMTLSSINEIGQKDVHWSLWNIPPDTTFIDHETDLDGVTAGINEFGSYGYRGPCPEVGERTNFVFEVWAVEKVFTESIPEWTPGHLMINSMGKFLGKSVLHTYYRR